MAYKKNSKSWHYRERPIFIDKQLLTSEAYLSLKTPACYIVYGIFLTKRQMENTGTSSNPCWVITNNGSITFTYQEARNKWNISEYKFVKAIANLVEVGLIDITRPGEYKRPNLYALSDRWKLYGKEDFIIKEAPKRITTGGFQRNNRYGCNCSSEERENYRQQLKNQKSEQLQAQIDQLKRDKIAALLEDKRRRRRSRIPAIIDELIDRYSDRLRKLQ